MFWKYATTIFTLTLTIVLAIVGFAAHSHHALILAGVAGFILLPLVALADAEN